jgi:hypothetical protein
VLVLLGIVAKIYPNLSDGAKEYQQVFLMPLPGMDSISILGDCTEKYQQGSPNPWVWPTLVGTALQSSSVGQSPIETRLGYVCLGPVLSGRFEFMGPFPLVLMSIDFLLCLLLLRARFLCNSNICVAEPP